MPQATTKLPLWRISPFTHDDVIKWKHFPLYWPFVRGIHRFPVNCPHKGQWCGALMFSLICVWINGWENNREAGDLRRHRTHYDVIVMFIQRLIEHSQQQNTVDNICYHIIYLTFHLKEASTWIRRLPLCIPTSAAVSYKRLSLWWPLGFRGTMITHLSDAYVIPISQNDDRPSVWSLRTLKFSTALIIHSRAPYSWCATYICIALIKRKTKTFERGREVGSFLHITVCLHGSKQHCYLSLAQSKLRQCLANHRAGYFSNLVCDWLSMVWAYSEQETENGPRYAHQHWSREWMSHYTHIKLWDVNIYPCPNVNCGYG